MAKVRLRHSGIAVAPPPELETAKPVSFPFQITGYLLLQKRPTVKAGYAASNFYFNKSGVMI